jgi:hypothetical protein
MWHLKTWRVVLLWVPHRYILSAASGQAQNSGETNLRLRNNRWMPAQRILQRIRQCDQHTHEILRSTGNLRGFKGATSSWKCRKLNHRFAKAGGWR